MNVDAVPVEVSRVVGYDGSATGSSGGAGMIVAAWLGRRFGDAVEHVDEDVGIEKDQRFPVAATGTIALPGCLKPSARSGSSS
jgi:hypothetical protein